MHPLRVLLIVTLALGIAVASAFGSLVYRAGAGVAEATILGFAIFAVFLIPWAGTWIWAIRRASDVETLIDRTRYAAHYDASTPISDRNYHGELDELALTIDSLRVLLVEGRESFREHRAAVDQIVGTLGEGLLAVNAKGRLVFANARFAEMFGKETAVPGRSVVEVARKHGVIEAVEAALRGEAIVTRVSTRVQDVERQIEIRAVPVKSSSEIAAVALFIDITDRARLERIRRDFLQDFSHEVRTPLAGLRAAAETFEGGQLTPEHEQALRQVIRRQIQRLERLVDDISELTRIESGDLVLEKRTVDLRDIASDICEDFRERTNQSRTISIDGSSAVVVADPVRLQQVLSNLIDNAAKHGGTEVRVEVASENGEGIVRVVDNGDGIPPAELDRIFNRFYRVDRSRSQSVPGLGLGLAIAKHLVLLHRGSIRAYNRVDGGAVFEVRIPDK